MNSINKYNDKTIFLMILITIGFALRVYALGDLGFRWDEDLTAITVKAVNRFGYPLLDSGMVYPRFLPLQYLLAAWTSIFGFSEYTIRFPIVLFGTALIPATYVIARDLVDERVALVAAVFMSLDFWEVELARTARMYAPFFLVYALFTIAVYRGILWNRRGWRIAIFPLGVLAVALHDVGLFCAAIVLLPALLSVEHRYRSLPYVVSLSLVACTAALVKFSHAMWALSQTSDRVAEQRPEIYLASVWQIISDMVHGLADVLYIPQLLLFRELLFSGIGGAIWILTLLAFLLITFRATRLQNWTCRLVALLAVMFASLHQFTLAFGFLLLFSGLQLKGIRGLLAKNSVMLGTILFLFVAFWLIVALAEGYGISDTKALVKSLFEYPRFRMIMAYPINRPLMSVFAVIGGCVLFDKCARPVWDKRCAMLLGSFLISYLAVGVFASQYSHFRYVLHADVFFMTLAAMGTVLIAQQLVGRIGHPGTIHRLQTPNKATTIIAMVLAVIMINPTRSVLAVTRDYEADSRLEQWMDIGSYPDYKTTSAFILANRRPTDQVLVVDSREFYNYLGSVDGWIQSRNYDLQVVYWDGSPHDRYIGAPLIRNIEELKDAIASHNGRTWLPFRSVILQLEQGPVDDQIIAFLRSNGDRQVMVGKDQSMVVYLFDPDTD